MKLIFLSLVLLLTSTAHAQVTGEIDLESGKHTFSEIEAVQVVSPVVNKMACLKITLDPRKTEFTRAQIEVHLGENTGGYVLNIGDSQTNNGCAGDSGTQSHDSELDIKGERLALWGSDITPSQTRKNGSTNLALVKNFVKANGKMLFEIADGFISWDNGEGLKGEHSAPYIFALNGQKDREGPENYDIYVGINRVVAGTYRPGFGAKKVIVRLYYEGQEAKTEPKKESSWFGVKGN